MKDAVKVKEENAEEIVDERLLAEYQHRLAALHYEAVGHVEALVVTPEPDRHCLVDSLHVVPEIGVDGQYPGKQWWRGRRVPGRQISAMNAEVLDTLDISYVVPGDNLIVRGLDLEQFAPGDTLQIGEALLTVTQTPHRPCAKFARRTSPTKKSAVSVGRRRGLLLDAAHPATIRVGDHVSRAVEK